MEATDLTGVLISMVPRERHAAETPEQLRKLRRHLKLVLRAEPDIREDTTALALMALHWEPSTRAGDLPPPRSFEALSRYAIERIDRIFGRRLNDEARWHLENRVWPWMVGHDLLEKHADDADRWTRASNLTEMMLAATTP